MFILNSIARKIRLTGRLSFILASATLTLTGCASNFPSMTLSPAVALSCDDSLKAAFKPDTATTVTLVKAFKAGEPLLLSGASTSSTVFASKDVCLVKLNVGPGNPGPANAPSTSAGIGMEIWLPSPANWNGRTKSTGDGAFQGNAMISSLTALRPEVGAWAWDRDFVSSISDGGHANQVDVNIGSFAMNPDGTINTTLWTDLATRSIHELALKTKALAAAYYAKPASYAYFAGCSGGGRTGYAAAQSFPADFNGIYVEAPSINQTQFKPDQMWAEFVTQRDLGGVSLNDAQSDLLTSATRSACDTMLNGKHDGYISDPAQCRYDPSTDPAVLCVDDNGTNVTSSCVSKKQAVAVNKMWYGPTINGTVPSPGVDNGFNLVRNPNHLWWGLPRGVAVKAMTQTAPRLVADGLAQVTLSLQNASIGGAASPYLFKNASGNGADGWKKMTYADFANAMAAGKVLNYPQFGNIDANNPDLSAFNKAGGKMITLNGLSDGIVPMLSTVDYYHRLATVAGGFAKAQEFHRLYLEPGRGHCNNVNGYGSPENKAPMLNQGSLFSGVGDETKRSELFDAMVQWVEKGTAPTTFVAKTTDGSNSRPVCMYPRKLSFLGGDTNAAASYTCK